MQKYVNITELSKILGNIDPKTKKPLNHKLRYWEKEFKQIKPKMINKRRYYTAKQIETIKLIIYLLKNKGMTISGVRNMLDSNLNDLDDNNIISLKTNYYKENLKLKTKNLLKKLNKLKKYGKKNTS